MLVDVCYALGEIISIHALRGEGDICNRRITTNNKTFQSTPSVGRAIGVSNDRLNRV